MMNETERDNITATQNNLMTAMKEEFYCSFPHDTLEGKSRLFAVMNNPEKKLSDCIGDKINIKDIFVHTVEITNEESGEVSECPRIIIIDDKDVSYSCVSFGIFNCLKKVIAIFGYPDTWEKPLPFKVAQFTKGTKKFLNLELITK